MDTDLLLMGIMGFGGLSMLVMIGLYDKFGGINKSPRRKEMINFWKKRGLWKD
jgi:hypothetical protein